MLVLEAVAHDARHDAVALEGDPGVFGGDEQVRDARFAAGDERVAFFVKGDGAGEQVGGVGQDVAVLADAGDVAGLFEGAQDFLEQRAVIGAEAEFFGERDLVEGLVFGGGEQAQDFRLQNLLVVRGRGRRLLLLRLILLFGRRGLLPGGC